MRKLRVSREAWPLARPFAISRGTKTTAEVVVAEISEGSRQGRGECVPYPRYGDSVAAVAAQIEALTAEIEAGMDRAALQQRLPAGAARNALDCALWDLEAKRAGQRAWQLAALPAPRPMPTAETIALDTPETMAARAFCLRQRPLLKLKLDAEDVVERVGAVRAAVPRTRLIVDANESWNVALLQRIGGMLAALDVEVIEQPLPAADDADLRGFASPVVLCADESCHTAADVEQLP
ncbi:MAG TPA: enolase C-terminal domain-like protein, partial [Rhodospirillales bacterium]|nr:enolase C-terminal domain-like protein [Rhodospirillales bacterium]